MRTKGLVFGVVFTLLLVLGILSPFALAQAQDEIALTRSVIQAQRQAIVAKAMAFTDEEGERFWPLFRDYRNDMAKLGDRSLKVITTYAENFENLSEETAEWMIKEYLAVQKSHAEVKANWVPRFREVLTAKQLARFYQVENKLDAVVNFDLAQTIPLIQ